MIQDQIHKQIITHKEKVDQWFASYRKDLVFPITSSFDIRDASFKVTNVDANIFPAGFNNICQVDKESAGGLVKSYLDRHYGVVCKKVLLLTEEHTKNAFYWENIWALKQVIGDAGREVLLGMPRQLDSSISVSAFVSIMVESAFGHKMEVFSVTPEHGLISVDGFVPDLIINNNDFSTVYDRWDEELLVAMNPPRELGWYQRKKHRYFEFYNKLAEDFARTIDVDPWLIQVQTRLFSPFDISDSQRSESLAGQVDEMISEISKKYLEYDIDQKPFVFIKNNAGTYGLGVTRVYSGEEVTSWNYKARKKMKASKGGGGISEVIIQEGVPSAIRSNDEVAEPAIYMIGGALAGGFLRAHSKKGPMESLNSPGAVFRRLCVSDLAIDVEGLPMENVYGWLAKIGTLALGREAKDMQVEFRSYQKH